MERKNEQPRICANCEHWKVFSVDFEYPEDECGTCRKHDGDMMYGDDDACIDFAESKIPMVRAGDWSK